MSTNVTSQHPNDNTGGQETLVSIAIIDDDPAIRALIDMALAVLDDFQVIELDGLGAALEQLDALRSCSLVIADIHLGSIQGPEVVARLRDGLGEAMPPVVYLSADVQPWQHLRGEALDIWRKPIDPVTFGARVRSILDQSQSVAAPPSDDADPLAALRADFFTDVGRRLTQIPDQSVVEARENLHSLAGSAATYGYPAFGLLARYAEALCVLLMAGQDSLQDRYRTVIAAVQADGAALADLAPLPPGTPIPVGSEDVDMPVVVILETSDATGPDPASASSPLAHCLEQCGIMVLRVVADGSDNPDIETGVIGVAVRPRSGFVDGSDPRPDRIAAAVFDAAQRLGG